MPRRNTTGTQVCCEAATLLLNTATEDAFVSVHRPFVDTTGLEILAPASRYSYQFYEFRKYTESLPGVEGAKHRLVRMAGR